MFVRFRDALAIKLMYRTGIRIKTFAELRECHVDIEILCLSLYGTTLKNHKFLKWPIDDELATMVKILIKLNKRICQYYEIDNSNIFITQNGLSMNTSQSSNCAISKQLSKYSKWFGLENINANAIRRAYDKNLQNKGTSIVIISKALGHSDLSVITQYLDLDAEEIVSNLREYLWGLTTHIFWSWFLRKSSELGRFLIISSVFLFSEGLYKLPMSQINLWRFMLILYGFYCI